MTNGRDNFVDKHRPPSAYFSNDDLCYALDFVGMDGFVRTLKYGPLL